MQYDIINIMVLFRNALLSLLFLFVSCFSFVGLAHAEAAYRWSAQEGKEAIAAPFGESAGAVTETLPRTIAKVIKAALGFLGIIFVIILIVAGFKYMLASGEDQTKEALVQIKNSIIGLVIVISSYAIAEFVIKAISGE